MPKIRLKRTENKVAEPPQLGTTIQTARDPDILTLAEAARFLRISPSLLYKLARERTTPCARLGRKYVFSRSTLTKWLVARMETTNETAREAH